MASVRSRAGVAFSPPASAGAAARWRRMPLPLALRRRLSTIMARCCASVLPTGSGARAAQRLSKKRFHFLVLNAVARALQFSLSTSSCFCHCSRRGSLTKPPSPRARARARPIPATALARARVRAALSRRRALDGGAATRQLPARRAAGVRATCARARKTGARVPPARAGAAFVLRSCLPPVHHLPPARA